jgi:hypothetical protein
MNLADELRKLTELRESGHLTDQEFADAKRRLLAEAGAQAPEVTTPPPLPQQSPQRKKSGCVRAFLIVFGLVFGLIIVLAIIGSFVKPSGSQSSSSASLSNAPAAATPTPTPMAQPPGTRVEAKPAANLDTDYKIGQEFKLGDYTYRITNFTLTSTVGNEFSREVAEEGEKFVVVSFTIRNDTNKTQQVLADDFEIKDAQSRQFANDSNASTALMMSGGKKDFFLREIQPGLTGKGITVFRVPADVAKQPMVLVVPQKGLFSSKKVTVLLTK